MINDLGFDALRSLRELRDYASICHPLVGPGHLGPKSAFRTSRRGVFAPVFCGGVVFGILKMLPLFTNS